jgi:hypothetical protein
MVAVFGDPLQFLRERARLRELSAWVILNAVKDRTLGARLLKLNRVSQDRGRGPSFRSG